MSSLDLPFDTELTRLADDISESRKLLRHAGSFLQQSFRAGPHGGGWRQFLNEEGPPTVGGTSCATFTIVNSNLRVSDDAVDAALVFLRESIEPDGGWTRPELVGITSTTLVTCLVARALVSTGRSSQDDLVVRAIQWLLAAQNDDHGWGYLPRDSRSDVTSTSYAMRALAAYRPNHDSLRAAAGWIMSQRHVEGSWGSDQRHPGTIAHTSHAVEALLLSGVSAKTLHDSREWIADELPRTGITPWLENYSYPDNYRVKLPVQDRLTWTHLPAERALIALLRLGEDPASEVVQQLFADLRARHTSDGYWQSATVPGTAPAWVMIEATQAICVYLERLEAGGSTGAVRQAWRDLAGRLASLEEMEASRGTRLNDLEAKVEALSKRVSVLGRIGRILQSRILLRAIIVFFTFGALLAYALVGGDQDPPQRIVSIVTLVATGLGMLALVQRRQRDE